MDHIEDEKVPNPNAWSGNYAVGHMQDIVHSSQSSSHEIPWIDFFRSLVRFIRVLLVRFVRVASLGEAKPTTEAELTQI